MYIFANHMIYFTFFEFVISCVMGVSIYLARMEIVKSICFCVYGCRIYLLLKVVILWVPYM